MPKFSIIVPVYNVEKYIGKCLNSIISQTYDDYELIVVCDKSNDRSEEIVDKYASKENKIRKIYEENTGLARAKNIGVEKSLGEYLLFVDGDDYIEENLLEVLNDNLDADVIRFQAREVKDNNHIDYLEKEIDKMSGIEAFDELIKFHYIENSWLYSYRRDFWIKNNFKFNEGCIAEDFGLTPLIIAKAKSIKSISFIGYNYVQRDNSLMNNDDYSKKIKKMDDMIKQAIIQKSELEKIKGTEKFVQFINNSLIYYSTTLSLNDYKKYNKILKKSNCFKHLVSSSFKERIRYFLIKKNAYFFFNYIAR